MTYDCSNCLETLAGVLSNAKFSVYTAVEFTSKCIKYDGAKNETMMMKRNLSKPNGAQRSAIVNNRTNSWWFWRLKTHTYERVVGAEHVWKMYKETHHGKLIVRIPTLLSREADDGRLAVYLQRTVISHYTRRVNTDGSMFNGAI